MRRSTVKRLRSPCSAADAFSGVLREEARRDIKIFLPLFIYRALRFTCKVGLGRHYRLQTVIRLSTIAKKANKVLQSGVSLPFIGSLRV